MSTKVTVQAPDSRDVLVGMIDEIYMTSFEYQHSAVLFV